MYDLSVLRENYDSRVTMASLVIGDLAIIDQGQYRGHHVLKTHIAVVSLTDPEKTWSNPLPTTLCRVLPPGDKLLLTVRE